MQKGPFLFLSPSPSYRLPTRPPTTTRVNSTSEKGEVLSTCTRTRNDGTVSYSSHTPWVCWIPRVCTVVATHLGSPSSILPQSSRSYLFLLFGSWSPKDTIIKFRLLRKTDNPSFCLQTPSYSSKFSYLNIYFQYLYVTTLENQYRK